MDPERKKALKPETELVSVGLQTARLAPSSPRFPQVSLLALTQACGRETRPLRLARRRFSGGGHLLERERVVAGGYKLTFCGVLSGPKQVGLSVGLRDNVRLRPLVLGGGQEGGVRSGTENVRRHYLRCTADETRTDEGKVSPEISQELLCAEFPHDCLWGQRTLS